MREMTVEASVQQIWPVTDFVNRYLTDIGCPIRIRIQIDVAVDELFGNIARYAYRSKTGSVTVRLETAKDPRSVIITFIDHGVPFNPLSRKKPDSISLSARLRPIGGLGIYIVRNSMDDVSYRYQDGQNILTIRKNM